MRHEETFISIIRTYCVGFLCWCKLSFRRLLWLKHIHFHLKDLMWIGLIHSVNWTYHPRVHWRLLMFSSCIVTAHCLLQLLDLIKKKSSLSMLMRDSRLTSKWNDLKSGAYLRKGGRALLDTNTDEHDGHCDCNTECLHLWEFDWVKLLRSLTLLVTPVSSWKFTGLMVERALCWYLYWLRTLFPHHWQKLLCCFQEQTQFPASTLWNPTFGKFQTNVKVSSCPIYVELQNKTWTFFSSPGFNRALTLFTRSVKFVWTYF